MKEILKYRKKKRRANGKEEKTAKNGRAWN